MPSERSGPTMDREAEFGRIGAAHRTAVHAYFVGRTGDRWAAADLMQEVFLRVWQRLPELTGMSADRQRAWIFTVARNLSIDTHRHERTRADAEDRKSTRLNSSHVEISYAVF